MVAQLEPLRLLSIKTVATKTMQALSKVLPDGGTHPFATHNRNHADATIRKLSDPIRGFHQRFHRIPRRPIEGIAKDILEAAKKQDEQRITLRVYTIIGDATNSGWRIKSPRPPWLMRRSVGHDELTVAGVDGDFGHSITSMTAALKLACLGTWKARACMCAWTMD